MVRRRLAEPNYVLRKDAKGWYQVRWTDPKTGRSKNKAVGTQDEQEAERRFGSVVSLQTPEPLATLTIGGVIDAYVAKRPLEITSLTPIKERIGYLKPSDLNNAVASSYVKWRVSHRRPSGRADGRPKKPGKPSKPLSNDTMRRDLEMLRRALVWGARNGLGYKVSDVGTFDMPIEKEPARDRWLTRDECSALIYKGLKDTLHVRLFTRIALAVGARREAILELTWDRVTFPEGKQMGARESSTLKSSPLRWVTDDDLEIEYERLLSPIVFDFGRSVGKKRRVRHVPSGDNAGLYRDLRAAEAIAKTEYVIEFEGRAPIKDIKTSLNKAYQRAEIPDASGAHILRHTCATLLVMSGLTYVQVGKITGMSAKTVEWVYGHHSKEFLQSVGSATAF